MDTALIGHQVLHRYRILQTLGQGGMGVVFLGRTEGAAGFFKPVVVKSILPTLLARSDMADMFIREAQILSNLNHPGIVRVLDFGREAGRYLMVLEYVAGFDLGTWRRFLAKTDRQTPVDLAVHIVCQVLDALNYAHELKRDDGTLLRTVHRDISPSNILLSDEGQVRILDFGIASIISDRGEQQAGGGFKGKLVYAAPELLHGGTPSPQSDIYSTAVVLYHLLAGKNPFGAPSEAEVMTRVREFIPPPLEAQRNGVTLALDAALARALSKNPAERYGSAGLFAEALRRTQKNADEALRQHLAGCLRTDFYGTLPEVMNTSRLEDRDRAWRSTEPTQSAASNPPQSDGTRGGRTVLQKPAPEPLKLPVLSGAQQRRRIEYSLFVRFFLPAVLVGAPLGWFLWPQGTSDGALQPSSVLPDISEAVPERQSEPLVIGAPSSALEDKTTDEDDGAGGESEDLKPSQAAQLTQTVSAHSELIAGCFDGRSLEVRPKELVLGFRLRKDGRVRAVTLTPRELAATDFGKCVATGYQAIRFAPQSYALKFRIPVVIDDVLRAHGRIP